MHGVERATVGCFSYCVLHTSFSPIALLGALASQEGPPEQVEPKADSHATLAPGNWSPLSPELLVLNGLW